MPTPRNRPVVQSADTAPPTADELRPDEVYPPTGPLLTDASPTSLVESLTGGNGPVVPAVDLPPPARAGSDPDPDDRAALLARIAELEAKVAVQPHPARAVGAGPARVGGVDPEGPVGQAAPGAGASAADAREAYQQAAGIISTEHPVEVVRTGA